MNAVPRVLLVTSSFPRHALDRAGAFLVPLAQALDARVLAPRGPAPLDNVIDGVPVDRVAYAPRRWERLFYGAGALAQLRGLGRGAGGVLAGAAVAALAAGIRVRRQHTDLVHAQWLVPGGLAAWLAGVPYVVGVHGSDVALLSRNAATRELACRVARASRGVWAPGRELAQRAQALLGMPVQVLPLPVPPDPLGAPLGTYDVGFLGRLLPQKGVDVLLRAAGAAGLSVLVGGDGPERESLERLAAGLGVRASFVGWLAPQERGRLWASIRALAVPSRAAEGAPAVVTEAQAAGIPVVGSAVPGIPEQLLPEALCPPDDLTAWAACLSRACHDEEFRQRQRAHGGLRQAHHAPDTAGARHRTWAGHAWGARAPRGG